VNCGGY
jgi:hypothetical protein